MPARGKDIVSNYVLLSPVIGNPSLTPRQQTYLGKHFYLARVVVVWSSRTQNFPFDEKVTRSFLRAACNSPLAGFVGDLIPESIDVTGRSLTRPHYSRLIF